MRAAFVKAVVGLSCARQEVGGRGEQVGFE